MSAMEPLTPRAQDAILSEETVRHIVAEMLHAERMRRRHKLLNELDELERELGICPRTADLRHAAKRERMRVLTPS